MRNEIIKLAEELEVGDVILQDGFDGHGMSTTHRFTVATVRCFTRKVRFTTTEDARTFSLTIDTPLRVKA